MNGLGEPSNDIGSFSQYSQYNQDPELDNWVDSYINQNTHLNFIDRVARPELYPTLKDKKGIMTHMMAWDHIDGKPAVYPTIIFDPSTMKLKQLGDEEAYKHAVKSKEFLPFNNEEEADLFSQQYKRFWRPKQGGYNAP